MIRKLWKEMEILDIFHAKANGRHRKNKIVSLEQDEGLIEGEENLEKNILPIIVKKLFGALMCPTLMWILITHLELA
jgi:hypothetical protein